jgi:hypothetical protein
MFYYYFVGRNDALQVAILEPIVRSVQGWLSALRAPLGVQLLGMGGA